MCCLIFGSQTGVTTQPNFEMQTTVSATLFARPLIKSASLILFLMRKLMSTSMAGRGCFWQFLTRLSLRMEKNATGASLMVADRFELLVMPIGLRLLMV